MRRKKKSQLSHSQGIYMSMRSGHKGKQIQKQGLRVQAIVQVTKSLHTRTVFAHPSLTLDLMT